MITARIQLDVSPLLRQLTNLERTQLPFATSLALNNLAKRAQENIREHYRSVFTLRQAKFIEQQGAKILRFANKRDLAAELGIDPTAKFLEKFEKGGPRPIRGTHVAIPVAVSRNKRDLITRGQRPRSLVDRLGKRRGAGGVFLLKRDTNDLPPGVFQRAGRKGRGGIKLLFALEDRAQVPASLEFVRIATRTADREWSSILDAALATALRSAR